MELLHRYRLWLYIPAQFCCIFGTGNDRF